MNFKDVIELITITISENGIGDSVETEATVTVFADKMGVSQGEKYQAMATGIKPSIKFKIRFMDYSDQSSFNYNGKKYKIVRKYNEDDDFIELTGEALVI